MNRKFSYSLIFVILLGILLAPISPVLQIKQQQLAITIQQNKAEAGPDDKDWYYVRQSPDGQPVISGPFTKDGCEANFNMTPVEGSKTLQPCQESPNGPPVVASGTDSNAPVVDTKNTLYGKLEDCGAFSDGASVVGCFVVLLYFLGVSVPSFLMTITASIFDYMANLTISSSIYGLDFIQKIWQIVRDFANIFFILILLYAAFQVILGLGHGGGKKMVAMVILVALLVNFSLFFSKVIIDSSNVLALIFYNKISCKAQDGKPCQFEQVADPIKTGITQRDLAGALVSQFNVNNFFTADFLNQKDNLEEDQQSLLEHPITYPINWLFGLDNGTGTYHLSNSVAISLIVTYALIAYSLAVIFLIVGLAFLSRMLTLIMLMIVAPLAFVTASVPGFRKIDTIGFDSWMKQLIEVAFSATVFMAILYLVSEIVNANVFSGNSNENLSVLGKLLILFLPAILVVVLLWKGAKYSMKASGAFSGAVMAGAAAVGGLALGAVTGGAALAGSTIIGGAATRAGNNEDLKNKANEKGLGGFKARMQLKTYDKLSKSSFDARQTKLAQVVGKKSGMDFQSASMVGLGSKEGGFKGAQTRQAEKLSKESELYKTKMTDQQTRDWSFQKQYEYDAKMNEQKQKQGAQFNQAEFEKKNGKRPEIINTAAELNHERVQTFKKTVLSGDKGLLGSVANSVVRRSGASVDESGGAKDYTKSQEYKNWVNKKAQAEKEANQKQGTNFNPADWSKNYDLTNKPPTAESINDDRTNKVKMAIGGSAAVFTGGLVGGAAIGAVAAGVNSVDRAGAKMFAASVDKEAKSTQALTDRIKQMKTVLEEHKGTATDIWNSGKANGIMDVEKDNNGNAILRDKEGKITNDPTIGNITITNIDKSKIRDTIATKEIESQDYRNQIENINKAIIQKGGSDPSLDAQKNTLMKKMKDSLIDISDLNSLKDIKEKIVNSETQLYNLTGQKSTENKK